MKKTAEFVSLGHPDKTADYISNYILDRMIAQDPDVKYAVEVMVKDNTVVLGCEIKGKVVLSDVKEFVKNALRDIGYDEKYAEVWGKNAIDVRKIEVINLIGQQSADINQGVVANGWGDQGVFVGYACKGEGLINREQFSLFEAWYKYHAKEGAEWFYITLLGGLGLLEQEARFTQQFEAKILNGYLWEITSELEIRDRPTLSEGALNILLDCDYDKLVLAVNRLHEYVHVTCPKQIEDL